MDTTLQFRVNRLSVEIKTKGCEIPEDERARLQSALAELAAAVRDLPDSALEMNVVFHPNSEQFHVDSRLKLPGRALRSGDYDPYLDSALQRSIRKTRHRAERYAENPDRNALDLAVRRQAMERDVVAPEDPDAGPLADAAAAGNYRRFRTALASYEEWLRKRVGRLVQRDTEAQAGLGTEIRLGDIVEEVYLNAFEEFTRRPTAVPLSRWLEDLIEPSIQALLDHPDEESEAASLARTLRGTSVT